MQKIDLMKMTLASVSALGDVFTDAEESAAAVAAAENLTFLAGLFAGSSVAVASGHLLADGEVVCAVDVLIDGMLDFTMPVDFDTVDRKWALVMENCHAVPVTMFEKVDDAERFVVEGAEKFYTAIFAQVTP